MPFQYLPFSNNQFRIVGKGNHSINHIQKIKPRVEQVCQELGLQYATEENEGRMYINLKGGPAVPPTKHSGGGKPHHGQGGHHQQQAPPPQQDYYPGGQEGGQYQQQPGQGQQQDEIEQVVRRFLPRILRKLEEKGCCVVM
jgi:hypothetical protein